MLPPLATAAYILASPRAVTTPLAAGTSPSRNGISPCTKDLIPGKNIAPNAPDSGNPATFGATKSNTGFAPGALRCENLRNLGRRSGRRATEVQAVGVERLRDLDAEELTHAHTRHGPGEPGENPSVRQRVVGRPAPLAIGRRRGEALLHQQVIEQFFLGHALEMRQPRPVP